MNRTANGPRLQYFGDLPVLTPRVPTTDTLTTARAALAPAPPSSPASQWWSENSVRVWFYGLIGVGAVIGGGLTYRKRKKTGAVVAGTVVGGVVGAGVALSPLLFWGR